MAVRPLPKRRTLPVRPKLRRIAAKPVNRIVEDAKEALALLRGKNPGAAGPVIYRLAGLDDCLPLAAIASELMLLIDCTVKTLQMNLAGGHRSYLVTASFKRYNGYKPASETGYADHPYVSVSAPTLWQAVFDAYLQLTIASATRIQHGRPQDEGYPRVGVRPARPKPRT